MFKESKMFKRLFKKAITMQENLEALEKNIQKLNEIKNKASNTYYNDERDVLNARKVVTLGVLIYKLEQFLNKAKQNEKEQS